MSTSSTISSRSSTPEDEGSGEIYGSRGRGRGRRGRGKTQPSQSTRGKGRGRGRGRGRGKAATRVLGENRAEEALHVLETRKERFMLELESMTRDEMKLLLASAMEQNPALMFELSDPARRQPGGYHPPEDDTTPDWCICTHCREMPTQLERVCCGKFQEHCTSLVPDFRVLILDEAVLALARLYRRDVLVFDDEEDILKANRHAAYRQYVLWTHGRLGVGDRRVIPSCCVWRIRDKYPDAFGQYTGFIPSRLV